MMHTIWNIAILNVIQNTSRHFISQKKFHIHENVELVRRQTYIDV